MCGLCGVLGITHWTEKSAHPDAFTGQEIPALRAERLHRVRLVNLALAPKHATLKDFQASSYILSSSTGRSEIVDDIQSVWTSVETLCGSSVDPLDPEYLAALGQVAR